MLENELHREEFVGDGSVKAELNIEGEKCSRVISLGVSSASNTVVGHLKSEVGLSWYSHSAAGQ